MRNSTGWSTGARKSAGGSALRRHGLTLIILGGFTLVAAGAVSQIAGAHLAVEALLVIGVVVCLAAWRLLVVARRRERSAD